MQRLRLSMAGDSAGFECYLRGSWWDVQIEKERTSKFEVRYTADEVNEGAWVPLTELRMSSRRADGWDCYTIKKGMDVAVLAKHPHTKSLSLEKEGRYDARVSSVARSIHAPGKCSCKFSVRVFDVKLDTFTDGTHGNLLDRTLLTDGTHGNLLDRILLTDEPEIEVCISDIRILQKPAEIIPLRDIFDAHLERKLIPFGRGCQDAYFLPETELSITTRAKGAFCQEDTDPGHARSAEVLSPSPTRDSGEKGERACNRNTPVDGVRHSRESLGTAEGEYRVPKSASGTPESYEQTETAGPADATSPQTINIKREYFSAEDHDHDLSNGTVGEVPPMKKRGRPRQEHLQKWWTENTRNTVVDTGDIEFTQLSSDTSDSETEWKPLPGVKKLRTMPSSIRTRDRTTAHKPKLEEIGRPSLRSATRSATRDPSLICAPRLKSHRRAYQQ